VYRRLLTLALDELNALETQVRQLAEVASRPA
jgi:hypothetical protein